MRLTRWNAPEEGAKTYAMDRNNLSHVQTDMYDSSCLVEEKVQSQLFRVQDGARKEAL